MSKRMLISVDRDESRAAVVEDGQLVHLEIEPVNRNTCKGNIYRAVVARVEPSLQSAFVDFGNDKQGFLPVGEIHPKLRGGNTDRRAPIQDVLRSKTEFLVQVVRDEIGQKGATLSTFISLPGRYLVLIPESEKTGVSRKLSEEARDRIKLLTEKMQVPEGFGLIVRTAGETATEKELEKDLLYLSRQWAHITEKYAESKGPTLLYAERSLPVRFVRDYFTRDIDEVVIDDDATLHEVHEFLSVLMPRGLHAITRYAGDVPLFARYGIEGKVEEVFSRQVFMSGGGSIVIDQTEALVSIDVNSGRQKEKDIEETARATNIEAATEIARQLILRDMGGLVVIDFIDMREKKYVREVEQAIKDAFKNDKARTKIGHISEFGLLEMSRQRIKSSVNKGAFDACVHCSGTGRMRAMDSVGVSVLRRIYELVAQKRVRYVIAMVPPEAARYLLNARRFELATIEKQYHLTIEIVAIEGMAGTQVVLEHLEDLPLETGAERTDKHKMMRVLQELDLVRNQLIKREEARIQLEAAAARRGAKVDYADIYREVREATPDTIEAPEPARKSRRHAHIQADAEVATAQVPAAVAAALPAAEAEWEELPQPRGFWASLKQWFGASEAPQRVPAASQATPTPAAMPAIRAAASEKAAPAPQMTAGGQAPAAGQAPAESGHRAERPQHERRERRDGRGRRGEHQDERQPRPATQDDRPRRDNNEDRQPRAVSQDDRPRREQQDDRPRREQQDDRPRREREDRPRRNENQDERVRLDAPQAEGAQAQAQVERKRPEVQDERQPATEAERLAAIAAGAAAPAGDEGLDANGRRRRRRRRRGGRGEESQILQTGEAGEATEEGDEEGGEEQAASAEAGTAPTESEGDAAGDDQNAHRRRRRRGRQADRPISEAVIAIDAAAEAPSEQEGEATAVAAAGVEPEAEAQSADVDAVEAAGEPLHAVEPAPVAIVPVETAVDAQSLVEAEIDRLKSEQEGPAEVAPEVAADEEAARPAANRRFVVDLRTGSR